MIWEWVFARESEVEGLEGRALVGRIVQASVCKERPASYHSVMGFWLEHEPPYTPNSIHSPSLNSVLSILPQFLPSIHLCSKPRMKKSHLTNIFNVSHQY